jgi:hypothetical protein
MQSKTPLIRVRPVKQTDMHHINHQGKTMRGFVVELDGELVGVAGVLHTVPMHAFSRIDEPLRKYPKAIMTVIRNMKALLTSYKAPVYAIADRGEGNSPKVLERIGFEYQHTNEMGRIFLWVTPQTHK